MKTRIFADITQWHIELMKRLIPILLILVTLLTACRHNANNYKIKLAPQDIVTMQVNRYDIDLASIDTNDFVNGLISISDKYSVFLGDIKSDTTGVHHIREFLSDPFIARITEDSRKVFPPKNSFRELNDALNHLKHYYPNLKTPTIYTYISGIDYEYPVIYNDDMLIIALDMYLGKDYELYREIGMPMYKTRRYDRDYLAKDCMMEIADALNVDESQCNKLIDWMIYYGKNIEFTKRMIPDIADTTLLGYTSSQMEWCKHNEAAVWKYLVSDEKLFSTDIVLIRKFIDDGPFTSLFSHDSPSSLGRWIGWKIVSNYCKNEDIDISQLMQLSDSQEILNESHYRPK